MELMYGMLADITRRQTPDQHKGKSSYIILLLSSFLKKVEGIQFLLDYPNLLFLQFIIK